MKVTFAEYVLDPLVGEANSINVTIDGVTMSVPIDPANRQYAAIMEQVDSGTLAIAEADNG